MTRDELTVRVQEELKGLSSEFVADDYSNAIDSAIEDTGFSLPNSVNEQIRWLVKRSKRHLFFFLASQSATKFKVKQLSLNQKFEQLMKLVDSMDKEFEGAKASDPLFGVDISTYGSQLFGHKIDSGFSSNFLGKDTTYEDENLVIIHPNESD